MKVYLKKDIERVGIQGEIIRVSDGFAKNFLFPKNLAIEITPQNQSFYSSHQTKVEHRKQVVANETSMLAEKIKLTHLTLKRKMHDGKKLYGSVSAAEISELLAQKGIKAAKNQIIFEKSIKEKGTYDVTIKLSSRLQPKLKLTITSTAD